ncbi:hypothetical protein [Agrobacterium cavarae]
MPISERRFGTPLPGYKPGYVTIFIRKVSRRLGRADTTDIILISGILLIPFQVVQISVLQPAHFWMVAVLALIIIRGKVRINSVEVGVFLSCMAAATAMTVLQPEDRIKSGEQLLKFLFVYPGFYIVGRYLGHASLRKTLPFGYLFLAMFLVFQIIVEKLQVPIIFQQIDFGIGALHGTFKERNWLSSYFFLLSYLLLLRTSGERRFIPFFLLNGVVTVLTLNKTSIVACGLVFLLRSRTPLVAKFAAVFVGASLYIAVLGNEFTQEKINVKLEEERGLAFQSSIELIEKNPLGYGFGFVEAYFAKGSERIKGLGLGTNSVFAVPLDMAIIAGVFGVAFWLVFFCGVGLGFNTIITLFPIAVVTLLNPLHQSEMYYLLIGIFVSTSLKAKFVAVPLSAIRRKFGREWTSEAKRI